LCLSFGFGFKDAMMLAVALKSVDLLEPVGLPDQEPQKLRAGRPVRRVSLQWFPTVKPEPTVVLLAGREVCPCRLSLMAGSQVHCGQAGTAFPYMLPGYWSSLKLEVSC
jgi:hypothetical protein